MRYLWPAVTLLLLWAPQSSASLFSSRHVYSRTANPTAGLFGGPGDIRWTTSTKFLRDSLPEQDQLALPVRPPSGTCSTMIKGQLQPMAESTRQQSSSWAVGAPYSCYTQSELRASQQSAQPDGAPAPPPDTLALPVQPQGIGEQSVPQLSPPPPPEGGLHEPARHPMQGCAAHIEVVPSKHRGVQLGPLTWPPQISDLHGYTKALVQPNLGECFVDCGHYHLQVVCSNRVSTAYGSFKSYSLEPIQGCGGRSRPFDVLSSQWQSYWHH